jgi:hypothetical protein
MLTRRGALRPSPDCRTLMSERARNQPDETHIYRETRRSRLGDPFRFGTTPFWPPLLALLLRSRMSSSYMQDERKAGGRSWRTMAFGRSLGWKILEPDLAARDMRANGSLATNPVPLEAANSNPSQGKRCLNMSSRVRMLSFRVGSHDIGSCK